VSNQHPRVPANLEQQHKLAKDLLRDARDGDAAAVARLQAVRADAGVTRPLQLADAQFAIARENGFDSWPALVDHLHKQDIAAFRDAVSRNDVAPVTRLLGMAHVREQIDAPMFAFGQRAAHIAAKHAPMLDVLIAAGADLTLESEWENGPYTVLDNTTEETARLLLARGVKLTPNVAARLGWVDELRQLLAADQTLVHRRGGDGQQPLHEAATVAIADLLVDHGADVDARCIDHKSTPAQYALAERPEICRRLLERGASADIFMPARLGSVALAMRVLDADPQAIAAHINEPGYAPVPPLHIYCWTLGFGLSPHDVALKFGHRDVYDLLVHRSPVRVRFISAVQAGDEEGARALIDLDPSLMALLTPADHARLAQAIFHGRREAAHLMLRLGFDETAGGVDGGTGLHAACWMGDVGLVEAILRRGRVPVETRDPVHLSTPLGWAAFGSVHRRANGGDYPAVVDRLVAAGADINAPGNGKLMSLIAMAEGNPEVQATLRKHGALPRG
jgi:ankyrin repeat protein